MIHEHKDYTIFKVLQNQNLTIDENIFKQFIIDNNIPIFRPTAHKQENISSEVFKLYCQHTPEKEKVYLVKSTEIPNSRTIFHHSNHSYINNIKEFMYSTKLESKFIAKPKGYYIENEKYFFVYKNYDKSLSDLLNNYNVDFVNKVKIFKMVLEQVKSLHVKGIISLKLSENNLKFSNKNILKLIARGSLDVNSEYQMDSFIIYNYEDRTIYTPPEILLNQALDISWHSDIWSLGVIISRLFSYEISIDNKTLKHFYLSGKIPRNLFKYIDNIFIQSLALGILKIDPFDRPNIFEIIDNYNNLVRLLNSQSDLFNSDFYIVNSKDEYIGMLSLI